MVYRNIDTGIEIETQSVILAPNWTPVGAETPSEDPEPVKAAEIEEEPKAEPEAPKKTAAKKKPAKKGAKK